MLIRKSSQSPTALLKTTLLSLKGCDLFSRPNFNMKAHNSRKEQNKAVKKTVGRWSNEERKRFLSAVDLFGDRWDQVEEYVGTRNRTQIENYALKEFGSL